MEPIRLQRISNLALPIVAAAVATSVMSFVDTLMVSRLGAHALGGVGSTNDERWNQIAL